jgi:uncharacterized protein YbjT (DUF2867 family)
MFPKSPVPSIFISALGTTRAQAGSIENQRKIDFDLNLAMAKAAKDAGVQTYVLISGAGTNPSSRIAFIRMKVELEEAVKGLGFKYCVLVKPGLIVGSRKESRPTEHVARTIANVIGAISTKAKDAWAQDADVIAKAAVNAGLQCVEGNHEEGIWTLSQADIVRLGRTEWKMPEPQ